MQKYSPADSAKVWDRQVNKKILKATFNPKQVIDILRRGPILLENNKTELHRVLEEYLEASYTQYICVQNKLFPLVELKCFIISIFN